MSRRIKRIRKKTNIIKVVTLPEILELNNQVITKYGHLFCNNKSIAFKENITQDKINFFTQFFIHSNSQRKEEMLHCLKENIKLFDNIYLLNERIYTQDEMELEEEEYQKISQIYVKDRLTYKIFLDYIISEKIQGYCILSNSDIFLNDTVNNLKRSTLSLEKSIFSISRTEYQPKNGNTEKFMRRDSQDTWIIHSNFLDIDTEPFDIVLGKPGCDNRINLLFHQQGFKIYNPPYFIRIYHYHQEEKRDYGKKDTVMGPYLYPEPIKEIITYDKYLDTTENFMNTHNLFWQYPVITEKQFYLRNKENQDVLGIPWATIIDKKINTEILESLPKTYKITCCQHIFFRKMIPSMKKLGIEVLYTPHKIIGEDEIEGIEIKGCPLYAVNLEDLERNSVFYGEDFLNRRRELLYSFRGGWNTGYMSDIRKKIFELGKKDDVVIQNSGGWHFEKAVYGGEQKENGKYSMGNDVDSYNQMLLDSRFSLCPSGSGPNSIRFWESLGTGSIPVLLSDKLDLPKGDWDDAVVRIKEGNIDQLDLILRNMSSEEERKRREKCLKMYQKYSLFLIEQYCNKMNYGKYDKIISYCCGCYQQGDFGGVARYDYQLSLIFKDRVFFKGPVEKKKMLNFLEKCKNPLVITDNQFSCDIPNKYDILLVHHGCAKTTALRTPDWGEPWKSLCLNGQNKMLDYRDPDKTTIISISQSCTDDFTNYYGEKYTKFKRLDILHPSELDETKYKNNFNSKPVILGNWNHPKKGKKIIPTLKRKLKDFEFKQLSIGCNDKNFKDFNRRKQDIYLGSDIFLQIATSEGNSYATLDAMISGLVIVASNVGLFYKNVPENCFVKLDWEKNNDINYVREKILEGWKRREELSKNCRMWYLDNCRFIDWEKRMRKLITL